MTAKFKTEMEAANRRKSVSEVQKNLQNSPRTQKKWAKDWGDEWNFKIWRKGHGDSIKEYRIPKRDNWIDGPETKIKVLR